METWYHESDLMFLARIAVPDDDEKTVASKPSILNSDTVKFAESAHSRTHSHNSMKSKTNGSKFSRSRPQNHPQDAKKLLLKWLHNHSDDPYPTDRDKNYFAQETGLTLGQVNHWFINARRRYLPKKPNTRIKRSKSRNTRRAVATK